MKKQIIILSMPNCGSDWFADSISRTNAHLKYFREFFNPITNDLYTDILLEEFGCELVSAYKNIARLNADRCQEIYEKTWQKEEYNFTKENYSVFKISFWADKFYCVALNRKIENTFPPSRKSEVYSWYHAIYRSMIENFDALPENTKVLIEKAKFKNLNFIDSVLTSFTIYQETFLNECKKYNIPVLNWENLVGSSVDISRELNKINFHLDKNATMRHLLKTKKIKKKDFQKYEFGKAKVDFL